MDTNVWSCRVVPEDLNGLFPPMGLPSLIADDEFGSAPLDNVVLS